MSKFACERLLYNCKGVRGPRAVSNLLCVRRSGVLGVEMKTLPVNCWLLKRREASCDIVL